MGTPRHRAIADELREAILGEHTLLGVKLASDVQLPSEAELSKHYEASRGTIREALGALAMEGLLYTRGRSGTFVRRLWMLMHNAHRENPTRQGTTDTWHSEVIESGHRPSQDFAFSIIPAEPGIARRLNIAPLELVVVRECTRYVDDIPWSQQDSFYSYELAKAAGLDTPHDIPEGTVVRMGARGFVEVGWEDEIVCRPAHEQELSLFKLPKNSWVMVYKRVAVTSDGVVRYTRETLPSDRNTVVYQSGDLSALRRIREEGES